MNNYFLSIHPHLLGKLSVCVEFGFGGKTEQCGRDTGSADRERAPSHPRATSQKLAIHENIFLFKKFLNKSLLSPFVLFKKAKKKKKYLIL